MSFRRLFGMSSLRGQLALILTITVVIAWLVGTAISVRTVNASVNDVLDKELQQTAERLMSVFDQEIFGIGSGGRLEELLESSENGISISSYNGRQDYVDYLVVTHNQRVLYRSESADPGSFPVVSRTGFYQNEDHRFYFLVHNSRRIAVYLQESLSYRRDLMRDTFLRFNAPLLIIVPLTLLAIWLVVTWALNPVRKLQRGIERRGEGNLEPIETDALPSEISSINSSVNLLLERLRKTLDVERRFISQAAHELRTPVAAAMAQTERLKAESTDDEARARVDNISQSLARLNRLCEKLLQLAKAEGGLGANDEKTDLRDILRLLVREFEAGGFDEGRLRLSVPGQPVVGAYDLDAYAILARNLIENALVHGDGVVEIALDKDGGLIVRNDCQALDEERMSDLARQELTVVPSLKGTGIGLIIAKKIALALGMNLVFRSPIPDDSRGFEAILDARCTQ